MFADISRQVSDLGGGRRTRQGKLIRRRHLYLGHRSELAHSTGEALRVVSDEGAVPERQGLLYGDARVARRRQLVAGGAVKGVHDRIGQSPKEKSIDAPAAPGRAGHVKL